MEGNGADGMSRFGIIRDAALYAGHGPSTVELFRRLWGMESTARGSLSPANWTAIFAF